MSGMVLVGLGSNRGDSVALVRRAIEELGAMYPRAFRASSLWRTSPVDCPPDSGDFVNAAVCFDASSARPEALLDTLKGMERRYGRGPVPVKNAPRELDLDLLLVGTTRLESPRLTLPHPRALDRRFVMVPAAQVVPDLVWPGTDQSVCELAAALETDEVLVRIEDPV